MLQPLPHGLRNDIDVDQGVIVLCSVSLMEAAEALWAVTPLRSKAGSPNVFRETNAFAGIEVQQIQVC